MSSNSSLRGAGFGPLLAAQRQYLRDTAANRANFGLLVPEAFVRGIRDLGYRGNGDALAELIDNALQAYADRIDVLFGFEGTTSIKKPAQLAVLDNGHGMEPDMIRMAVMWGGTHRENDRSGLGRYGYGLPCSSVSLGRRFTVLSQVRGGRLHSVTLDLDEITAGAYTNSQGEIIVPAPQPADPPAFVVDAIAAAFPEGWDSGTIILIDKLDRLEWATSQGLRDNLCRQFGVTYHKLRGEAALFVDGLYVEPIDPLFLTNGFHLFDFDDDRAERFDPVRVEVRDPDSGDYRGAITLRYAWFPPSFGSVDKARDAVGLNANARFSILKDFHGIIFSRNGRLIDVQTRTPWTSFINNDRYIKVEVEFSATLDELFGVTTSKQQVTVSSVIWDCLRQAGLPKAIEQLRAKVREAKLSRRTASLEVTQPGQRASERAMSAAAQLGDPYPAGHQWDMGFRAAPYRLTFWHEPGADFFKVDREAGARTLRLNSAHRFFTDVYDGPETSPPLRAAIEIMLFCMGDVTLELPEPQRRQHLPRLSSWSLRLDDALSMLSAHLHADEDGDEVAPGA